MNVLGIHDGHVATACLLVDGSIVAMASEERFNRSKSYGGIPLEALKFVLAAGGVRPGEIDAVAVPSLVQPLQDSITRGSVERRAALALMRFLPQDILRSSVAVDAYRYIGARLRRIGPIREMLQSMGISTPSILQFDHHLCHASSAILFSPRTSNEEASLVFTLDASGDGLAGSVSRFTNGALTRLRRFPSLDSLGELYSRVTQQLGMQPYEHEYKVMGLAPWARNSERVQRAREVLTRYISNTDDNLGLINRSGNYGERLTHALRDDLAPFRFDEIAAALQLRTEEVITNLVRAWVRHTGIRRAAFGGGVFMNIKAAMRVAQLEDIGSAFFLPSCGDESLAMGAAAHACRTLARGNGRPMPVFEPLKHLYFGPEFTDEEVEANLRQCDGSLVWSRPQDPADSAATLLAEGHIVARFAGRMEWGARALGNRSILANASDLLVVNRLNRAVKMRDFWMPFAPSILYECRDDYVVNPRHLESDFMNLAFDSTPLARREIPAALHQSDYTCRPQFVRRDINRGFHDILARFRAKTGVGGVLNTSFNLHGEPIVCSPADALHTFLRSGLEHLLIGSYLVTKKVSPST